MFNGTVRPVDSVNVWPMITGQNETQPRPYTPTSEYGIIKDQYKLVTLGGQSNYYTNASEHVNPPGTVLPCLTGTQPHPGGTDNPVTGCPVCNITHPCLFDIMADPTETTDISASHPEIVQDLLAKLQAYVP